MRIRIDKTKACFLVNFMVITLMLLSVYGLVCAVRHVQYTPDVLCMPPYGT